MNAFDKDKRPILTDGEIDGEGPKDNGPYLHVHDAQAIEWFADMECVSFQALHNSPEGRDNRFASARLSRFALKPS